MKILISLLIGILALNANEAKIQEKAEIGYKETIKYIETKIKELETIIQTKNTEINAAKKDIKLFKEAKKEIQKDSLLNQIKQASNTEIDEEIKKIYERISTIEGKIEALETFFPGMESLMREDRTKEVYIFLGILKNLHLEMFKTEITRLKASIISDKAQIKALKALNDLKKEINAEKDNK